MASSQSLLSSSHKVLFSGFGDTNITFIRERSLYVDGWDTLPQAKFWRSLIKLAPDTGYLNVAANRAILVKMAASEWEAKKTTQRDSYVDSLRSCYGLACDETILFSKGKGDFYKIDAVVPTIDRAIRIFEEEKTDPFYAQAILLIESPGRLQKSNVGAYGAFQLMRSVAIRMGLKVNKYVDERKDFDKCAKGAARLLRTVCIPEAKNMLERRYICYDENDFWFKLLVLHIYHAGAGNVAPAIDRTGVCEGGNELIRKLWKTKHGAFGNASQNYTQVAIASLLELETIVYNGCEDISFELAAANMNAPATVIPSVIPVPAPSFAPVDGTIYSELTKEPVSSPTFLFAPEK